MDPPDRLRPVAVGVQTPAQVPEVGLQIPLVRRHRHPVDSHACLPPLPAERPFEGGLIDVMQQSGEPGMDGSSSRCVHPGEVGRQGDPALRPDPGRLARDPLGPAPSLGTPRFLRRRHQYYEPVRLPTSARANAPALPRIRPPPETNPADPVGPLMFQRLPSMRETAFDPGGAAPSRLTTMLMLPS